MIAQVCNKKVDLFASMHMNEQGIAITSISQFTIFYSYVHNTNIKPNIDSKGVTIEVNQIDT